jgi:methoxymalonate biosynthesis acyl carrier protein
VSEREKVHGFVEKLLAQKGDTRALTDAEPLLTKGRLDSIDVLDLVAFLENELSADFSRRDFNQNDFDSVDEILKLVETLRAS